MEITEQIQSYLDEILPDAACALVFSNPFECLCAVMLSAQTTDKSVNQVTPALFKAFPDAEALSKAKLEDVENIIKRLGLYRNKAKNLIALSTALVARYQGEVPNDKKALTSLPGVGVKTANVVLAECYGVPAIAVDTHLSRVSKRLGLAKENDDPITIESKLEKRFPKERWIKLHHQLIWFGRIQCKAISPNCKNCKLQGICRYFKKLNRD